MIIMRHELLLFSLLTLAAGDGIAQSPVACHNGAFRTRGGDLVVIAGASEQTLRYYLPDGRTGWIRDTNGASAQLVAGWRSSAGAETAAPTGAAKLGACDASSIDLSLQDRPSGQWERIPMQVADTQFASGDVQLRGRLVAPMGDRWPVVVLVHGSESSAAINAYQWQYLLPAQGIGVFVFDKRGTGGSQGTYTQDFHLLAKDVSAAVAEARRMAGSHAQRVGVLGGSQGGWIAPLAASQSRVDFVVVAFGLLISALREDRAQVLYDLRKLGYDDSVLARAGEVADATAQIVLSGFKSGYARLATLKKRYGKEPWFAQLHGEYTGELVKADERELRREGKSKYDNLNVPWQYEPLATVAALSVPQLWILGGEDADAPSDETIAALHGLQAQGRPIDVVVFPQADHGMVEFELMPDGSRVRKRYAAGFFDLPADWLRERVIGRGYGRGVITLREMHPLPATGAGDH
jgi:uncharacterized protein